MSSNTPTIDLLPDYRYHPNPPGNFPDMPPPKDYSLISDQRPSDSPPIPTRSPWTRPRQPEKSSFTFTGLPFPTVVSTWDNAPDNLTPTPRTSFAHLGGLRVKPKVHSGSALASYQKQPEPHMPQISDTRAQDLLEELRQDPAGFYFPLYGGANTSPPMDIHSHDRFSTPPPSDMASLEFSGARNVVWERSQPQRLEREFAALSLQGQKVQEQDGYVGSRYPRVQVQQFPQVQHNVVPQQQQQQQQQHQHFRRRQYVALPQKQQYDPFQAQQNVFSQQQQQQEQQKSPSQVQQHMATPTLILSSNLDLLHDLDMSNEEELSPTYGSELVLEEGNVDPSSPFAAEVDHAQTCRCAQFAKVDAGSAYRSLAGQRIGPSFERQQHQQQFHQFQQAVMPQRQQQKQQPPIEVQQGLYMVYDPVTQGYKYACEPLQNHRDEDYRWSAEDWSFPGTPKRPSSVSQPISLMSNSGLSARVDQCKPQDRTSDKNRGETQVAYQHGDSRAIRSGIFPEHRQELLLRDDSATLVGLSEATADDALEMVRRESLRPDAASSTGSDELDALGTDGNTGDSTTIVMPQDLPHIDIPIFAEARGGLERLQADIEDLSDSSDDDLEAVAGDHEAMSLSLPEEEHNDHITNNVHEETNAVSGSVNNLPTRTGERASLSGGSTVHKRSQLDDTNEDRARAEIAASRKRTKLSSLRFICCFHDGPGRKCSGTDDTISEVLKKLSEQHDTHVCDRCWLLKIKDESSGLFVHPHDGQACLDHCLSPQCHKTTPTIGHRHLFNQVTCGTKTSRVRPGDSEAVYRFIYRLVHPAVDPPSSVLTTEHRLHLDAVPRQSRRKLNREELTARANDLEKRLESGEQQNLANAIRIMQLEQQLADAHRATSAAEEKNAALEKQSRRIIAMLSDALRTGVFLDSLDHQSLLRRVEEDAPGALIHQSQALLTPSALDRSRNSSSTPVRHDAAGQDSLSRPAKFDDPTVHGYMPAPWSGNLNMEPDWLNGFNGLGDNNISTSQI